ncbi:MAG: family 10 glycosylhydrolase [Bacteroidota bacterium]
MLGDKPKAYYSVIIFQTIASLAASFLLGCSSPSTDTPPPKREFRAVWVATFHNIDWPSKKGLDPETQRKEFLQLVDVQQANGMNALVVQVRPAGDAFYKSELTPWSEYLTGTQGKKPEPYYDPLKYMVNLSHSRNLEFHAWFNPFRAVSHEKFSSVSDKNISKQHPEWIMKNGKQLYLNPGIPEVRDHVIEVILEVVRNYDIDGIHFDDYFYPYEDAKNPFDDSVSFATYGKGQGDIRSWRRSNIDRFIERLSDSLQQIKPHLKFGVSPVGIWRNKTEDPRGSNTRVSYTAYDVLYADVRKWLKKGWIDYVAPQLYWSMNNPKASYHNLLPWWSNNSFGRHLYIGQAVYKTKANDSKPWKNPNQLPSQLRMNQQFPKVKGSIFYSANSFQNNPHKIQDKLRNEHFKYPALVPGMKWKDSIPPLAPQRLTVRQVRKWASISWQKPKPAADGEEASYYVIYRFKGQGKADMSDPSAILAIQKETSFVDWGCQAGETYLYIVSAVDRLHNESRSCAATMYSPEPEPISSK